MRRVHVRDRGPGPRDGVVDLGRVRTRVVGVGDRRATRHEHLAIGQQRGRGTVGARRDHLPGGGPGPAGRVVQLGAAVKPVTRTLPSPSNVAVAPSQRSRRPSSPSVAVQVPLAGSYSCALLSTPPRAPCRRAATWPWTPVDGGSTMSPGGGPGPGGRVIQLRGGQVGDSSPLTAYHEHPAIEEPHRRVSERGVTIDPVGIQTPPGPATGIGLADGAADSLGLGDVASGDAVATAIDRWLRHRRDDRRQPQEAGARRQRPTDEQQGCGREKRDAAAPAEPSGGTRRRPGRRVARRPVPAIAARAIDPASNGPTRSSASERRAAARRRSNWSKSCIAKFSPEPKQQAREPAAGARRRHPERASDLVGAELGHVAQGDQGPVGRIEGLEDAAQVRARRCCRPAGPSGGQAPLRARCRRPRSRGRSADATASSGGPRSRRLPRASRGSGPGP